MIQVKAGNDILSESNQQVAHTLLTAKELAPLLGLSDTAQVYERAKRNEFPKGIVIRIGRNVRFSRSKVTAWLNGELEDKS